MSQDCFHQTLICLQKICVDNLKKKKKNLQFKLAATKMCACVCVCICVSYELTLSRRGMLCARVCVCVRARLAGLPALCQASIPASHHASLPFSFSLWMSFICLLLPSVCPLHLFIWIPRCLFVCRTHWLSTHTLRLIQYSLCLSEGRGPLENTNAHIGVLFWSDCISSQSEGLCLFSLTACELMSLFSQPALPRCIHPDGC